MVNYNNSKIYKIVPNNGDDMCYIGNTTKQYLSQRMVAHKANYKKWKETGVSCNDDSLNNLFDKYGIENCKILLIENFSCNSKDELDNKTNDYVKTFNTVETLKPVETNQDDEPSDEYLINIRAVFMKYKNRYEKIDKNIKWNEANKNLDVLRDYRTHEKFMKSIITEIKEYLH